MLTSTPENLTYEELTEFINDIEDMMKQDKVSDEDKQDYKDRIEELKDEVNIRNTENQSEYSSPAAESASRESVPSDEPSTSGETDSDLLCRFCRPVQYLTHPDRCRVVQIPSYQVSYLTLTSKHIWRQAWLNALRFLAHRHLFNVIRYFSSFNDSRCRF